MKTTSRKTLQPKNIPEFVACLASELRHVSEMTTARFTFTTSRIRILFALFVLIATASADDRGFKVVGWGAIFNGQAPGTVPLVPDGLTNIVSISAGNSHAMALRSDGTVVDWGYMWTGATNGPAEPPPAGLTGVVGIAAGASHCLALKSDGTVVAWGNNQGGQINVPSLLNHVIAIAAGAYHSLALKSDGTLTVWGQNVFGEGIIPSGLPPVVAISAESVRTFALTPAGRVLNWGKIYNNGWVDEIIPPSATNVIAIDAGQSHTLALLASRTVIAWGQNDYHQLDVPPGLHDVTAICAGPLRNLALTVDGSLFAWGDDSEKNIPSAATNVVAIAAGVTFDLALVRNADEKLPPMLFMHPFSQTASAGKALVLKADAVGEHLAYQWRKNGSDLPGANRSVYMIDNVRETNRGTYSVVASNPYGSVTSSNAFISVSTPGGLEFPSDTYNVAEAAGTIYIQVIRRGSLASAATVQYSTHGESATAGIDYIETSGEFYFAVNQGTNYFTVPIGDDQIPEDNETFTITLTGEGLGERTTARVNITDNDAPFNFAQGNFTVTSGAQQSILLPIGRQGAGGASAAITYATHAGSATPGVDYVETSGTLQFAAGEQFKTLSIPILDAHFAEPPRSFTVTLSGSYVGTTNTARITILGSDLGFEFAGQSMTVTEGVNGNATISVRRSGGLTTPGAVAYRTVDRGTAEAGVDYIETNGTLQFAAGESTKSFDVPILDDTWTENTESFVAILSAVSTNSSSTPEKAITVNILDDDRALEFAQQDYYVQEGAQAAATLTVLRAGTAVASRARVVYATLSGSATAGSDYVETTEELDFAPGETAKTFTLPVLDDNEIEPTEVFQVKLFALEGALGQATTATVHIADDERGFEISGDAYVQSEAAATNVIFTVSRSGSNASPATVHYATHAGTAKPGQDYIETTGTLQFAAGENSKTISIPILDDSIMEPFESFTVVITSDSPLGSRTSATVYIDDDDRPFEFTANSFYVSELNTNVMLTVSRAGTSGDLARIIYFTRAANAIPGTDYTETTGVLEFAPGEKSKSFTIPILDDNEVDGLKTFTVTLFAIEGTLGQNTNATVTIQDDERAVSLDLSSTNLARPNGAVRVLVRLPDERIFIGGEFAAVDNHSSPGVVRLNSDASLDNNFTSSLSTNSIIYEIAPTVDGGAVVAGYFSRSGETQRHTLARLKPDGAWDDQFKTGIGVSNDQQGNSPGGISSIQVLTDGRLLIGGAFQYVDGVSRRGIARLNNDGTLDTSFQPVWSETAKIRVQDDGRILVSTPWGDFARLLPDGSRDSSFRLDLVHSVFDFALQSEGRILVGGNFTKVNDLPRAGLARLAADGTVDLSFPGLPSANESIRKVWPEKDGNLLVLGDFTPLFRVSPNGIVDLRLSNVYFSNIPAALPEAKGTLLVGGSFATIQEYGAPFLARLRVDGNGKGLTFSSSVFSADEATGSLEISLDRWGTLAESFTVRLRTLDGSATAGADYSALNQEITFAPGERQKTVRVPILDDGRLEGPEDFLVTLEQVTPGVALGPGARVVIQDNEVEPETDRTFESPVINGGIFASAVTPDGRIYLTGDFTQINGIDVPGLARLHADGTLDTSFAVDSSMFFHGRAVAVQPDGQLIIGIWDPDTGGGLVVRVCSDGSLDTNFIQHFGCYVPNLAVQPDGKVLAAEACGGNNIVRFNTDGTTDAPFAVPDLGGIEVLRALADGHILVGGPGGIVRLTAKGDVDMKVTADGNVQCITPLPNGQLLVGGNFSQIADQPRAGIARLNPDGSVDPTFLPGAWPDSGISITGIVVGPDGRLLVGGSFTDFHGHPRNGLMRLKPDGTVDESDYSELPSGFRVASLAPQAGGVVVVADSGGGGEEGPPLRVLVQRIRYDTVLSVIDLASAHFAAGLSQAFAKITLERRGDTTEPATVQYRAAGSSYPEFTGLVEFSAGERFGAIQLPIAGHTLNRTPSTVELDLIEVTGSTVLGSRHADLILVEDQTDGAADQSFVPFLNFYQPGSSPWVSAHNLAVQSDGKVLIGGYFQTSADGLANSLIRLNPDGTLDSSFHTDASIGFLALTADGKILAPGGAYGLERFLPDGSLDTTFNPTDQTPDARVVLPLPDRRILVGGQSRSANNGFFIPGLGRLLEDGSLDPAFHPLENINNATALALIADGSLLVADLRAKTRLLLLAPDGSINPTFKSPTFNGFVSALMVQQDNRIVIGGSFSLVNQTARVGIARIQPNGELDPSFDPGLGFTIGGTNQVGGVNALLLLPDDGVVAAGSFSHVAGVPHWNFAKLDSAGTFDPTYGPANGLYGASLNGNSVNSLAFTPDDDILAAGQFDHAGPLLNPLLVRLHGAPPPFELAPPHLLQTGEAELTIPAAASPIILEAATSLSPADWQPIATNNTAAPLIYRETSGAPASQRFYRATHQ
jgi:uncharacterized delta-60 repeat protein